MDLYKLKKKDIQKSAVVLAKAFYNYPTFKYIFGEHPDQEHNELVFRFIIKYAVLYAKAYANSPKIEGIILFSEFKDYNFSFFRSLRCGGLSLMRVGSDVGKRFAHYNQFCLKIHNELVKEPHYYVILNGVDPEKQNQGIGGKLLRFMLQFAKEKNQPCYLETHGNKKVDFYKKFGFRVVSEDIIPDTDISQFAMLKEF
jgi:ribosomal protein S18 acetylase RimI-like enzyme